MYILGDIGNTETKIFIVSLNGKIIKKIFFPSKNINQIKLNKVFNDFNIDFKKTKKILFCSVVPNSFNLIKKFLFKKTKVKCYEVKNLNLTYTKGGPQVLFDISFEVMQNDFYAIIGPSGAGKSSLIRCINKLANPNSGEVNFKGEQLLSLGGQKLRNVRRRIGMIFQEFNLIDRMSVIDNVLTGRLGYMNTFSSLFRMFSKKDVGRAIQFIEKVGLKDFANKRVDQLSGGQRQRVGIARALMQEPEMLLVDEPTSSLDPKIAVEMMELIKQIADELKIPVLCNIHNIELAKQFANKILGLQDGKKKFDDVTEKLTNDVLQDLYKFEVL